MSKTPHLVSGGNGQSKVFPGTRLPLNGAVSYVSGSADTRDAPVAVVVGSLSSETDYDDLGGSCGL